VTYLVEEQNVPFAHETHAKLDPPPLSIRDLMHVPVVSAQRSFHDQTWKPSKGRVKEG
jgi:hypothetical protein